MSAIAIVQSRMSSSRLPGKSLMQIGQYPMLQLIIERLNLSKRLSRIVIATTEEKIDKPICILCSKLGVSFIRGSRTDVLSRFGKVLKTYDAEVIVRVTGDCPLIDPYLIDNALDLFFERKPDYLSFGSGGGFPLGVNAEIIARDALIVALHEAKESFEREHVTPFLYTRPKRFKILKEKAPIELRRPSYRITVDEKVDIDMINQMINKLGIDPVKISLRDVISCLDNNPKIQEINSSVYQKEFTEVGN